ncbi:MAG: hypothetical protein CVV22_05055 [Ignavibacteriae bacterium HGW-Ignavibacteriae-1]|jgi:hypothetical protein|nr:MAG: hypothetical protein CVV22_05055 [Ignavibacteriae bacterium HGW-Ignavibacteriae-1]
MRIVILIILVAIAGCNSCKNMKQEFVPLYTPGPPTLVYKTKNDYNNLVPVILNDDKTEIVSYPHPNDLKLDDGFPNPTILNNGYLLDNRGIGKNVAFLKLTYKEYSELPNPPTLTELYNYIIDKDPLTELCNCGNKSAFTDIEKQLNDLIDNEKLRLTCRTIK